MSRPTTWTLHKWAIIALVGDDSVIRAGMILVESRAVSQPRENLLQAGGRMEVGVIARPYSLDLRERSVVRVAAGERVRK
jgi:hypothetical protein